MRNKRLTRSFFEHRTVSVARSLLGTFLVRKVGKRMIRGMIVETEAYVGPNDRASHASRGRTLRSEVMFGPPGRAYVYRIYGIHHCLNVVTERQEFPAAVLVRSVTVNSVRVDGPGRVSRIFQITRALNREDLTQSRRLWIEDRGVRIPDRRVKRGPRIGVEYAGAWRRKPWRFTVNKN